jgi:hypothetical protein
MVRALYPTGFNSNPITFGDFVTLSRKPTPIETGTVPALRLGVYGEGGVGKTTLALSFPKPLVIDTDGGLEGDAVGVFIDGEEWAPERWQDLNELYLFIKGRTESTQYGTIVVDSIDQLAQFLLTEATNMAATGRSANATDTQLVTAQLQDYGKVANAMRIFLTKLKVLSRDKGIHIVLTSAVREANPDKGRMKRTFDVQEAIEHDLLYWCNIYGELEVLNLPKKEDGVVVNDAKGNPVLEENRILWTRVGDIARKNKTRFGVLRPGVGNPTFEKIVGLIKGEPSE